MPPMPAPSARRGLRRLSDIPDSVRGLLSSGATETANWTEWMATDMCELARTVAAETKHKKLSTALLNASHRAEGKGILNRLTIFGDAVSFGVVDFEDPAFLEVQTHRSDVVRQWGAYAVNEPSRRLTLAKRLKLTIAFAADLHMSVRECAWMAFRPHLAAKLADGLRRLEPFSHARNANVRRFSIEVCRPRSVWGTHIAVLKSNPEMARALLENVNQDPSRYVRLAVGNWLNDASKTRPDWVREICSRWASRDHAHTTAIVRRGLRTLNPAQGRRRVHEANGSPAVLRSPLARAL